MQVGPAAFLARADELAGRVKATGFASVRHACLIFDVSFID